MPNIPSPRKNTLETLANLEATKQSSIERWENEGEEFPLPIARTKRSIRVNLTSTKDTFRAYPLRFEPIYQNRIWGGRRLAKILSAPLPGNCTIGEAWVLSDRTDHASLVSEGPFKGQKIGQLLKLWPSEMLGRLAGHYQRFPLLLKFLDAHDALSVQVHPSDEKTEFLPAGETGKTEAWLVLEAGRKSRIYAGLKTGTTAQDLRSDLTNGKIVNHLSSFVPKPGDGILIEAGTVHALRDTVIFEVQQNSDVTYRLYDWDHVDAMTGRQRPLQVEQAMACIDFSHGAVFPKTPILENEEPVLREGLFDCGHFGLKRHRGDSPFTVGVEDLPRIIVCIAGQAALHHAGVNYALNRGDVILVPAVVGACKCEPIGEVTMLEISLPERA